VLEIGGWVSGYEIGMSDSEAQEFSRASVFAVGRKGHVKHNGLGAKFELRQFPGLD